MLTVRVFLCFLSMILSQQALMAFSSDTVQAHTQVQIGGEYAQTDRAKALAAYQSAYRMFLQAGYPERALEIGNEAAGLMQGEQALDWLAQCRIETGSPLLPALGTNWHLSGRYYTQAGQLEQARDAGLQAYHIRKSTLERGHRFLSFSLINLSNTYTSLGRYDSALWAIDEALANWEVAQPKEHPFVADCYNSRANAYLKKGDFVRAEQCYQTRLAMFTQMKGPDHPEVGHALHNLGIYFERTGQYQEAAKAYEESLRIRRIHYPADHPELAKLYNSMGILALQEGNLARALSLQTQALDIRMKTLGLTHPLTGQSSNNLGNVYREMKRWDEAERYLLQALQIWQASGTTYADQASASLNNLGNCRYDRGDYATADSFYRVALNEYASIPSSQISMQVNRGLCALKMGHPTLALELLREAADKRIVLLGKDHPHMSIIYGHIAEAHEALEDYPAAARAYFQGIEVLGSPHSIPPADTWKSPRDRIVCLTGLTRTWFAQAQQGDQASAGDSAWHYAQLGSQLLDSLTQQPWERGSRVYWLNRGQSHLEIALEVAFWLATERNDPAWHIRAFPLAEQHKSILLAAHRQQIETLSSAGIPDSLQQRSHYLRGRIRFFEQVLAAGAWQGSPLAPDLAQAYRGKAFALRDSLSQLNSHLAQTYPRYHAWKRLSPPPSIADLQSELHTEAGIWSVFCGKKALYLWGITPDKVQAVRFAQQSWPMESPKAWLDSLRSPALWEMHAADPDAVSTYQQKAYAWFEGLLTQVFSAENFPTELTLVPDGWLGFMPFEALVTQISEAQTFRELPYLLRQTELRYRFSLRKVSQPQATQPKESYLGFAPSYQGHISLLPSLPLARQEVSLAAENMQGRSFLDREASEARFRNWATQSRILHLAGHAEANDSLPDQSALFFTYPDSTNLQPENDGVLYAYELYDLELSAEMVVLSGCQTAYGSLTAGEGIMSLARAFAYAGCDRMVASLWSTDDQSSQAITQSFFSYMAAGKDASAALQQAKLDFLQESPLGHPGFWAALVLVEAYSPSQSPSWMLPLGIAGLLVIGGLSIWVIRKRRAV